MGILGEWKLKFAQLSKANWGVWEVLRVSIHSPPGRVNRDGRATARECGTEWVGPHFSCVPALYRVGTGRPLSHANELECDFIYTRTPMRKHIPQNEHLFATTFSAPVATCRLTAGRLSTWFHCLLLYRPLTVQYLEGSAFKYTCNNSDTIDARIPDHRSG